MPDNKKSSSPNCLSEEQRYKRMLVLSRKITNLAIELKKLDYEYSDRYSTVTLFDNTKIDATAKEYKFGGDDQFIDAIVGSLY